MRPTNRTDEAISGNVSQGKEGGDKHKKEASAGDLLVTPKAPEEEAGGEGLGASGVQPTKGGLAPSGGKMGD